MSDAKSKPNPKALRKAQNGKKSGPSWLQDNPTLAKVGLVGAVFVVVIVIAAMGLSGGDEKPSRSATAPAQPAAAPPPPAMPSSPQPPVQEPTAEAEEAQPVQEAPSEGNDDTPDANAAPPPPPKVADDGPRPEDVTQWKRGHYFSARAENDPKLIEAVEHFGGRFVGSAAAARMLTNLLAPLEPEEEQQNPGAPRRPAYRNPSRQAGATLILATVAALGANGTDVARASLEGLLAGTLPNDNDTEAVGAVLQALVDNPSPENEAILLRALTATESLRPQVEEEQVPAQELRDRTLALARTNGSERFRLLLADYVFQPTTPTEPRETLLELLRENEPRNIGAQLFLYEHPSTDDETRTMLERYFTGYSADIMTHLLGLTDQAGTQRNPQGYRPGRPGRPQGYRPGRPGNQQADESDQADPDLPYRIAQRLWGPECLAMLDTRLRAIDTLPDETQLLVLASTIPVDSLRSTLRRVMDRHYEDGGQELESAGWSTSVVGDPGVLLVVKALPRSEPRDADSSGGSSRRTGSSRSNTLSEDAQQREDAKQDWMAASESMVRTWCERFYATSQVWAEAERLAGRAPNFDPIVANLSIPLHAGAEVAGGYQTDWPNELTAKLSGVTPGAMAVRYVRIEENARLINRQGYYRRQLKLKTARTLDDGVWLDSYRIVPQTDRKLSVDVLITRVDTANSGSDDEEPVEEEDLVIEILSIETKDPAPREM